MATLRCNPDETFSAYLCVVLFDSIGYELYPQDIQEARGRMGLGISCTFDLEKAQTFGKEILIVEFRPTPVQASRSGASEILVGTDTQALCRWRERGFSSVLYEGTEIIIRADCIQAVYRREWSRPESAWDGLSRLMARMRDPPLSIDSDTVQNEATWTKAIERLKRYGDQQVLQSRERLEAAWKGIAQEGQGSNSPCVIA